MYPELISRRAQQPIAALVLTLIVTFLAPSVAVAEWSAGVQGGAVIRNGDRSNRLRFTASNPAGPLTHLIYADWIINDGDDSFELGYRPRYFFTDKFYGLVELSARTDDPIGIERETTETLGVGYQFIRNQGQQAFLEFSAGARQIEFTESIIEDQNEPFGRIRASYSQVLGDVSRFNLDLSGRVSDIAVESSAEVSITLNLATFAVSLGYRIISQNIDGQDSITDDTTTVSFGYRF